MKGVSVMRLEQQTITCDHCGASTIVRSDDPGIQHWPRPVGNMSLAPPGSDEPDLPCPDCGVGQIIVSEPVPIVTQ